MFHYPATEIHFMIDQSYAGDVPTPRSGHAVAHYGKYMFLYGGINFAEEVAYNDLYVLDTGTYKVRMITLCCVFIAGVHFFHHFIQTKFLEQQNYILLFKNGETSVEIFRDYSVCEH